MKQGHGGVRICHYRVCHPEQTPCPPKKGSDRMSWQATYSQSQPTTVHHATIRLRFFWCFHGVRKDSHFQGQCLNGNLVGKGPNRDNFCSVASKFTFYLDSGNY